MYHLMVLTRRFDDKLFSLQRQGKIGTYAQVRGQEAIQIASAKAMQKTDWMIPAFRETGVYIARGVARDKLVQAWMGDVGAFENTIQERNLAVSIPVGSQPLHATGIAWANKIKKNQDVAITYFGDGATSEGDFHEALNIAGVHKLPVIFICQNNQYAISTPRTKQTASKTIAQKAIAYEITGIKVDGNDVIACYKVVSEAIERARKGEGPTLIEAETYRLGDHTTSDDAKKYRAEEETKKWENKDPIIRLQKYLEKEGKFDDKYKEWVENEVAQEIEKAILEAMQKQKPTLQEMFDTIYTKLPKELQREKEEFEKQNNTGEQQ